MTYRIHFNGLVQGIGFRPYVYRLAKKMGIKGWVSNGVDGVHMEVSGSADKVAAFYDKLIAQPPVHALITKSEMVQVGEKKFKSFTIRTSDDSGQPDLLIPPDMGICQECLDDLSVNGGHRYKYPFTTCTKCGPRYSIIKELPYDRPNTTMDLFQMCSDCLDEYEDPISRRYFSQTNSCNNCPVPIRLTDNQGQLVSDDPEDVIERASNHISAGSILAVKGIGGYLLLADATNAEAVLNLRQRKKRGSKPFALLYPDMPTIKSDVEISTLEKEMITGIEGPILLLRMKQEQATGIKADAVAPNMNTLGIMLPYAPVLKLLMDHLGRPVVATSGNLSGSPIFYKDGEAMKYLSSIADLFLANDREIIVPQDDSVIRCPKKVNLPVFIRRSRGYTPNFIGHDLEGWDKRALALGAQLKSTFSIQQNGRTYVSQYLGSMDNYDTTRHFQQTLDHLEKILRTDPEVIITDMHPSYFTTDLGKEIAVEREIEKIEVQHHKAHFYAVLAENKLINTMEPVLGVVWDGTGYGDDGNIWGGEFFSYRAGKMKKEYQMGYYDHILGDKMPKEPRLSALSIMRELDSGYGLVQNYFSDADRDWYLKAVKRGSDLKTSSIGRLFDGVAAILGLCGINDFEGEAAMRLQSLAERSDSTLLPVEQLYIEKPDWSSGELVNNILRDLASGLPKPIIAFKFHQTLAHWVQMILKETGIKNVAFTGGVFQNTLLIDLLYAVLKDKFELYFHRNLSPNDECISVGQLAALYAQENKN